MVEVQVIPGPKVRTWGTLICYLWDLGHPPTWGTQFYRLVRPGPPALGLPIDFPQRPLCFSRNSSEIWDLGLIVTARVSRIVPRL